MTTTTYYTETGSIYIYKNISGDKQVLRQKLGEKHTTHGNPAKRAQDGVDGEWRKVSEFICAGIGDRIRIQFINEDDPDDKLYTSRVVKMEDPYGVVTP